VSGEVTPGRSSSHDLVRPFVITGGRTRAVDASLRVETMVQTIEGSRGHLTFEHARIVEHCLEPLSIAEIAAQLDMPLGVAMVLVGDLVAEESLEVSHSDPIEIELSTLTRMIDRVRAL
jgi:Protein of unknown function (DUF742)